MTRLRRTFSTPAFSLVEILVTMAVTLLLVLVLLQIFSGAQNTWRRSEQQVDAYREARGALQLMARDLGATLQASYAQPGGGAGSVAANPLAPTLVLERYPGVTPFAGGPINEEVYCLTNIPNSGASKLCAIGYFCQWMPGSVPVSADGQDRVPRAYALMRQSLDSDATFLRFKSAATAGTSPLTFLSLFSRDGMPTPSVTQVAAYIWDLRFRIDTDLNDTSVADGNVPPPPDHSSPPRFYSGDVTSVGYPTRLPTYVEIRFKALSDIAGRRLEGPNTGVDQTTWKDDPGYTTSATYRQIMQPNFQQFILRVPLISGTSLPTPTPAP